MFDVVTTAIYTYTRYPGGPELEDRTLALKLFAGRHQARGDDRVPRPLLDKMSAAWAEGLALAR